MNKLDRIIQMIRDLKEESGPTMAMGHGQIALGKKVEALASGIPALQPNCSRSHGIL